MKFGLAMLFLVLCSSLVSAAPMISDAQGVFVDGQSITISGVGFGIKTPVEPLAWMGSNYESGVINSEFSAPSWSEEGLREFTPIYTDADSHSGSQSLLFNYTTELPNHLASQIVFDGAEHQEWFMTTWLKLKRMPTTCDVIQWKHWRISNMYSYGTEYNALTTSFIHDPFLHADNSWFNNGAAFRLNTGYSTSVGPPDDLFLFDEWDRIESYYRFADNPFELSGYHSMKRYGRNDLIYDMYGSTHESLDWPMWRYFRFGIFFSAGDNCPGIPYGMEVYYDDMYIDSTRARIELCNSNGYSSANHCEIQIPHTTWNDNQIQFSVNQGSFTSSDVLYLFVVDADGVVSNPFEVVIGSSSVPVTSPTIYSLSSEELSDGQSITVSGAGFGVKSPVEPLLWDDFEDGIINDGVAASDSKWLEYLDRDFIYANDWSNSGVKSAKGGFAGLNAIYPADRVFSDEVYMTGWINVVNMDNSDKGGGFIGKMFRVSNSQTAPTSTTGSPYNGLLTHNFGYIQNLVPEGPFVPSYDVTAGICAEDIWIGTAGEAGVETLFDILWDWNVPQRVEHYTKLNTPGVADGVVFSRNFGKDYQIRTDVMQRLVDCTDTQLDTPFFELGATNLAPEADFQFWGDDFYADYTQARIELCNNQDKSLATHCEIQIPHTTWNNNQIQFTVNQGSFTSSDDVYLFVVDEDGQVSSGFGPLRFDGGIPSNSCSTGVISSECECGGSNYSTGFCCSDLWNPTGCSDGWQLLWQKDFEDGIIEDSIFKRAISTEFSPLYSIDNGALTNNMKGIYGKRYNRIQIDLGAVGVDPRGEFILEADVKFNNNNLWCCSASGCYSISGTCPNGIDGMKMTYAFGNNGVSWVPETNPSLPSESGRWHFFDNRGGATAYNTPDFLSGSNNLFDNQWHKWTWHFKHNTQSNNVWQNDGVFEMYLDGVLVAQYNNVPYTVDGYDGSFNYIDKPVTFFGGGLELLNDFWYWVDNVKIMAPSTSVVTPVTCGNGFLDVGEACDASLFLGGVAPSCPVGLCGLQTCTSSCSLSTSSCTGFPVGDFDESCAVDLGDVSAVSSLRDLVILGRALLS